MARCTFILLFLFFHTLGFAQKPRYTDFKPKYEEWNSRYILDKITYWKDRTVFHFRYAAYSTRGSMTFYGPLHQDRWCLVNTENPDEQFPEIELRKVTRENTLIYGIFGESHMSFSTKPYEIYTVEVHFPALPSHITEVDFLEGVAKRSYTNHFHCFNVRVKPFNDNDLGTIADMTKRVDMFEIRTLGWAKTALSQPKIPATDIAIVTKKEVDKPEKKPEVKPQPKPKTEAQAQGKDIFAF